MRPVILPALIYATGSTTNIANAQAVVGASAGVINGALSAFGTATLSPAGFVAVFSSGNDNGITITVTGTNRTGVLISETVTGGNGTAVNTTRPFQTVTGFTTSGSTAGTISLGAAQAGATDWVPMDMYVPNSSSTIDVVATGTVNYTVQYTNEGPWSSLNFTGVGLTPYSHPAAALVGASASQIGSTSILMRSVRLMINSGSGSAMMRVLQQGAS